MAATDHWMRFNVGDYLADTMHLTAFQHGIYLLLIMHYFKRGDLPDDEASLARIAKISVPQWRRQAGPAITLFSREGGAWRHRRVDAERQRARDVSEVKQAAGKKGAQRRWKMAHAISEDGTCHPKNESDSRARTRVHAKEPEPDNSSPPFYPPGGGTRTGGHKIGVKGSEPRNGFTASILADMENADADYQADAPPSGATVVPISRRVIGG
jgi:uncharacterized protein YdaU (DUF1376 family)